MRTLVLTLAGLGLCLPAGAGAASLNFSGLDDVFHDTSKDTSVEGVVKSVDSPNSLFTVTVEKKGDVQFRVSPQTSFDSEVLGGVIGKEVNSGLEGLKTGDTVRVKYLTVPPDKPVAAQVQIEH